MELNKSGAFCHFQLQNGVPIKFDCYLMDPKTREIIGGYPLEQVEVHPLKSNNVVELVRFDELKKKYNDSARVVLVFRYESIYYPTNRISELKGQFYNTYLLDLVNFKIRKE